MNATQIKNQKLTKLKDKQANSQDQRQTLKSIIRFLVECDYEIKGSY